MTNGPRQLNSSGRTVNPPKDAWREIEQSINQKYDDQIGDLNSWASDELSAVNEHYDSLISDVNRKYEDLLKQTNDYYDQETNNLESSYRDQVSATERYYSDLLDETTTGLDDIKKSRDAELDDLELNMLSRRTPSKNRMTPEPLTKQHTKHNSIKSKKTTGTNVRKRATIIVFLFNGSPH
jgi:hypothetical protein